jgi:hypothetical protein
MSLATETKGGIVAEKTPPRYTLEDVGGGEVALRHGNCVIGYLRSDTIYLAEHWSVSQGISLRVGNLCADDAPSTSRRIF